ncbi:DNA/RNA non-specific endonuclease [Citrifermentans bremense]|uniref:DNA/RNA non-specific endonuclease n=1 Tax=Citrifermentans bremense TaxID=60035 RepID=UPI00042940ED|nr:DNA/RNA non-specific endonuclease [Citrifermentans bremense]
MAKFLVRCGVAFLLTARVVFAGPLEDCQEYVKYGVPSTTGDILCRKGYLLAHDPIRKTPTWVVEHLTVDRVNGALSRKDQFKADPDLPKGRRAELSDYRKSGYDQGHMAPSADMAWDELAMSESFYLSNMVPQVGTGMNRGIWKDLEEKVRKWALERESVYIFTGPIYSGKEATIGKNRVAVPDHLYKIVFDPQEKKAIAFIMPNRKLKSSEMSKYIVSVRDVETTTGLDFLSALPVDEQELIETVKSSDLWPGADAQ